MYNSAKKAVLKITTQPNATYIETQLSAKKYELLLSNYI